MTDKSAEQSRDFYRQDVKVGVYVCHCGGNISDIIDVEDVARDLSDYPGVSVSRNYIFMCSSTGQGLVEEDIRTKGINRVVIAACSPALHELTFRGTLERAGLNPYLYEHVNIREQGSWVHKSNKKAATEKSKKLIRAAVEKICRQNPLEAIRVNAARSIAVIGGGVAGMSAALSLGRQGFNVYLIEKENRLGGKLNSLWKAYPSEEDGEKTLEELEKDISSLNNINIYLESEVKKIDGYVGNFSVEIVKKGSPEKIKVGALVITTGYVHYIPFEGEYAYKTTKKVVTLPDFIEMLKDDEKNGSLKNVKSVAFIHCVGSRQNPSLDKPQKDEKVNDYCSRTCCTSALFRIKQLLEKYPDKKIFDFYRDIRTYGLQHESYYEELSKKGVLFFRYPEDTRPQVEVKGDKLEVKSKDILTWNEEVSVEVDMVVLLTGVMPADISVIVDDLKLPIGSDRFILEAHPKLRPVEVPNLGIYIGGTAQAPMDLLEAAYGGKAAASKASMLLSKGEISLDPFVASVNPELCDGCEKCIGECLYPGAIVMENGKAKVIPALCKGCGACAAVCHTRAINVAGYSLEQIDAMVEAISKE